jgi:hypothetical protein
VDLAEKNRLPAICPRPVLVESEGLMSYETLGLTQKGDRNRLRFKNKTVVRNDGQAAGLTSILLLTATPGFALFANSIAFLLAAWVRTVPDNVTSFLTASAFTLRSADFNCGSFSSFVRTAFSKSESLIDAFQRSSLWADGFGVPMRGCRPRSSQPIRTIVRPNNNGSNKICFPIRADSLNGFMNYTKGVPTLN